MTSGKLPLDAQPSSDYSTFSEKGDQLQNCDVIFFSQIFGPVCS